MVERDPLTEINIQEETPEQIKERLQKHLAGIEGTIHTKRRMTPMNERVIGGHSPSYPMGDISYVEIGVDTNTAVKNYILVGGQRWKQEIIFVHIFTWERKNLKKRWTVWLHC